MRFLKLFTFLMLGLSAYGQSDLMRTVCSAVNSNVNILSTTPEVNLPSGTTYTWTTVISPSLSVNGVSDDQTGFANSITQTLTNISATPSVVTYTITPSVGNSFIATITVNPTPSILDQAATICSGSTFNIVPTQTIVPAGTTYTWGTPVKTGGSAITGGVAQSGASIISDVLSLSGTTTQTATYAVIPTVSGCQGNSFNVVVTVKPTGTTPQLTSTNSPADRCSGSSATYTATATNTSTFAWTRPLIAGISNAVNTGSNATAAENLINTTTAIVKVTYLYTLTNTTSGCVNTVPVFINIRPIAVISSPQASSMCSAGTPFASPTFANIPSGTTFNWTTPIQPTGITGGSAATVQTSISQVLRNSTNAPLIAAYTVTPVSNGCNGSNFTLNVTVNPLPNIVTAQSVATCSGSGFTFTPTASSNIIPANTTYTWAATPSISPSSGAITGGSPQTVAQTAPFGQILTNTTITSPSPTATYTITPTAGTCVGNTFNLVATVNPVPAITPLTQNVSVCSGTRIDVTPQGVPTSTRYAWSLPQISPQNSSISGATSLTNQLNFSQTLVNTTTAVATAIYTVVPIAGTCTGTAFTITVTVNPTPVIATQTTTSCSGTAFNLTPSNAPVGTTYTWSIPTQSSNVTGGSAQTIAQNNISQTLTYLGVNAGTATYTVIPTANSCTGNSFLVIDTISPLPIVPNLTGTTCSGIGFTVNPNSSLNNTTYTWLLPQVNPSGVVTGTTAQPIGQSNITDLLTNTTSSSAKVTYNITPAVGACVGKPFTLIETINPTPAITNLKTTVCSDDIFTVTPPNTPVGTVFTWLAPVFAPLNSVTGGTAQATPLSIISQNLSNTTSSPATVTYSVTPIAGSCIGNTFAVEVLVNSLITSNAQSTTICSGNSFTVTPSNAITGTTYTWSTPVLSSGVFGGTAQPAPQTTISQTLNYVGATIGTATYTVTPYSGGCTGRSFTVIVTINPLPSVSNLIGVSCSGVGFTANPNSNLPATTYTWSLPVSNPSSIVSGGTNQQVPQVNISEILNNNSSSSATATYIVTPYAAGCVGRPFTFIQTVNPTPDIANLKTIVCSGNTFIASPPNAPVATTYTWTAPAVTPASAVTGSSAQATPLSIISQNLTNITSTPATVSYSVTPTTGSCTGNTFTVEVLVNISANLTAQAITICSGNTFNVQPTGVPSGTTYTWATPLPSTNVGGTSAQNVAQSNISQLLTYNGINNGTAVYTVTPNSAGCIGRNFDVTVTIKPLPLVADLKQADCSGASFVAIPTSNLAGTTYTWATPVISPENAITGALQRTSGVVNISQTLTNITNRLATATYTVTPTANGCAGNTFVFIETINPIPSLATQNTTVCSGNTFNVAPTDVPIGITTVYTWSTPVINPVGSITGSSAQVSALTVISQTLTNNTISPSVATYNVTPSSGGCIGNPFAVVVTINPKPNIANQVASTCSGTAFNIVPANAPAGTKYIWDVPVVSNGIIGGSIQTTPQTTINQVLINTNTNSSAGTAVYTVTPITAGCMGSSFTANVSISSNSAVLSSTLVPPAVCSGASFNYTPSSSTTGTAFTWTRDVVNGIQNTALTAYGNVSEVLVNTTAFPVNVAYKFSLSSNGCVNLNTQIVNVTVNPAPALSSLASPPAICTGSSFNYAATSNTFNVDFRWDRSYVVGITDAVTSGNGNISETLHNPTYNAVIVPYIFKLSANGCTNTQTVYVTVNPVLTVQDMSVASCSGSYFSVTPPNAPVGTTYLWSTPVQTSGISGGNSQDLIPQNSIAQNLTNIGTATGTATYTVVPITPATYTSGCTGHPFSIIVSVNPIPSLSSTKTPPAVCSGNNFNYIPTSATPGSVFFWSRDVINGISNFAATGTTIINEILLDTTILSVPVNYRFKITANGCTDTTQTIAVNISPSPIVKNQNVTICSNAVFSLPTDLEPLKTNYVWDSPVINPPNAISGYTSTIGNAKSLVSDTLVNLTTSVATATYNIQPSGSACGLTSFTAVVTVKPRSTIQNLQTQTCSGVNLNFTPVGVPAATVYTWQSPISIPFYTIAGATNQTIGQPTINQNLINLTTNLASANYAVVPNTNGCIGDTFLLRVNVNPTPTVTISGNTAVCRNISDTLNLFFTGTGPWTYSYVDSKSPSPHIVAGVTNSTAKLVQSALPTSAATYTFGIFKLSDAFCSNDTSTATIMQQMNNLPYDTVIASSGTQICFGKTTPLFVSPSQSAYQWYLNDTAITGASSINYDASKAGVYSASVTNSLGCINKTVNKITTTQLNNLKIQFNYITNCKDLPITFKNTTDTSGLNNLKWLWLFGDGDSSQSFHAVHTYKTVGTKLVQLKASVPVCNDVFGIDSLILVQQAPDGIVLPSVSTYTNTITPLHARTIQGYNFTYRWKPAFGLDSATLSNPIFYFNQSQSYVINMTNPLNGCITKDTMHVRLFDTGTVNIFVPKSFTPNHDGTNDILYPYVAGIKDFHFMKIYNKYGKLLFETKNVDMGWDGTFNSSPQSMDVYVWVAEATTNTGQVITKTGNVLLLR